MDGLSQVEELEAVVATHDLLVSELDTSKYLEDDGSAELSVWGAWCKQEMGACIYNNCP